jgi:hypothetical protein
MKWLCFLFGVILITLSSAGSTRVLAQQAYCEVPVSPFKHSALILTRMDESTKRMRTTLEYPRDPADPRDGFYLFATFLHQDMILKTTPMVSVLFSLISRAPTTTTVDVLKVAIDDRAWVYKGKIKFLRQDAGLGQTMQGAAVNLNYDELVALTKAKRVEVKLGSTSYVLTEDNFEALREVASIVEPYAKNAQSKRSVFGRAQP